MRWILAGCTLLCAMIAHSACGEEPPNFKTQVTPLFEAKCIRCHGAKKRGGKLDMRTLDAMLVGGATGPALVPGNAKKSLLIELIHYQEMPPKKEQPRVTPNELEMLRAWINGMESP